MGEFGVGGWWLVGVGGGDRGLGVGGRCDGGGGVVGGDGDVVGVGVCFG